MPRVIAGSARGTRLMTPDDDSVRPTRDRVREAVMSALGGFFADTAVLDLCAGTGAIGIELLSRGCERAVFVERDATALVCLRHNVERCRMQDRSEVLALDARAALDRLAERGEQFDIVYVDPPYDAELYEPLLAALTASELVAVDGEIVLEQRTRDAAQLGVPGGWQCTWERRYGTTTIRRIARAEQPTADKASADVASNELADYDFELPSDRIAQHPAVPRDTARLLRLPRESGPIEHHKVTELADLLPAGAVLVINDTRVMPARLMATKDSGGKVEILLARPAADADPRRQPGLYRTNKKLRAGVSLRLADGSRVDVVEVNGAGQGVFDLSAAMPSAGDVASETGFAELLRKNGQVPLPPYIRSGQQADDGSDADSYQCIYARKPGAVAAPTAGLHFTDDVLASLAKRGVQTCAVTLHVGPGTFLPVRDADLRNHSVLPERFELSEQTAATLAAARAQRRPIIAVGTTTTRVLETVMARHGAFVAMAGDTAFTIRPGHRFAGIDGLLTNFHLPRSSLLVLVSAFVGRERLLDAYRVAIEAGYRFYSYGDCMLIGC